MLYISVNELSNKAEDVITDIVNNSPILKVYLMIHSVFRHDVWDVGDWFERHMCTILEPSPEQVEKLHEKREVPNEILEALAIFDPIPSSRFEELWDDNYITYKLWGNYLEGEPYDPIVMTNRRWEKHSNVIDARANNQEFLSKFETIRAW